MEYGHSEPPPPTHIILYYTHTELYVQRMRCKDDLKLFKYDDSKFELSRLPGMWSLNGLFNDLTKKDKSFLFQGIINTRNKHSKF